MKIAIWGFWNGKNLGDMWILENMKKRFNFLIPISINTTDFENYDFIIIGGGGLFNGPLLRKPFDTIKGKYGCIGLGGEFPILEYNKLEQFISNSQFFGVRDSSDIFKGMCANKKLEISADCTFLYPLKTVLFNNYTVNRIKLIWRDPNQLIRWEKLLTHKVDGAVLNSCFADYLGKIPFDDNFKCQQYYKKILSRYGDVDVDDFVSESITVDAVAQRFMNTNVVVSMRYHGIVAAIQLGIPVVALDIYPKVRTLMRDVGLEKYCIKLKDYNKLTILIEDFKNAQLRDQIRSQMEEYKAINNKKIVMFCNKVEKILNK